MASIHSITSRISSRPQTFNDGFYFQNSFFTITGYFNQLPHTTEHAYVLIHECILNELNKIYALMFINGNLQINWSLNETIMHNPLYKLIYNSIINDQIDNLYQKIIHQFIDENVELVITSSV